MQKNSWSFAVPLQIAPVGVTRWGHYGVPVVLFASAGGDSLEPARLLLIAALAPLLDAGRIKVYAVDGTAMQTMLAGTATAEERIRTQRAFDEWVESGLGPHIRQDCQSATLELLACGCALGAASALKALLRAPSVFRGAIGLSGTYDLLPWLAAPEVSPLQELALLPEGPALSRLRQRPVTLACTAGDYDHPAATHAMADRLAARGVATRTEVWGADLHFGFASWRQMLPRYVGDWL